MTGLVDVSLFCDKILTGKTACSKDLLFEFIVSEGAMKLSDR